MEGHVRSWLVNASEVSLSRIILFASNPAKRKECVDTLLKIINDVSVNPDKVCTLLEKFLCDRNAKPIVLENTAALTQALDKRGFQWGRASPLIQKLRSGGASFGQVNIPPPAPAAAHAITNRANHPNNLSVDRPVDSRPNNPSVDSRPNDRVADNHPDSRFADRSRPDNRFVERRDSRPDDRSMERMDSRSMERMDSRFVERMDSRFADRRDSRPNSRFADRRDNSDRYERYGDRSAERETRRGNDYVERRRNDDRDRSPRRYNTWREGRERGRGRGSYRPHSPRRSEDDRPYNPSNPYRSPIRGGAPSTYDPTPTSPGFRPGTPEDLPAPQYPPVDTVYVPTSPEYPVYAKIDTPEYCPTSPSYVPPISYPPAPPEVRLCTHTLQEPFALMPQPPPVQPPSFKPLPVQPPSSKPPSSRNPLPEQQGQKQPDKLERIKMQKARYLEWRAQEIKRQQELYTEFNREIYQVFGRPEEPHLSFIFVPVPTFPSTKDLEAEKTQKQITSIMDQELGPAFNPAPKPNNVFRQLHFSRNDYKETRKLFGACAEHKIDCCFVCGKTMDLIKLGRLLVHPTCTPRLVPGPRQLCSFCKQPLQFEENLSVDGLVINGVARHKICPSNRVIGSSRNNEHKCIECEAVITLKPGEISDTLEYRVENGIRVVAHISCKPVFLQDKDTCHKCKDKFTQERIEEVDGYKLCNAILSSENELYHRKCFTDLSRIMGMLQTLVVNGVINS